ncbi:uncharacterized protein CDAR_107181 [Caerostris darwini]|uniref:Protein FAM154B n=1 Tax=Caerostris darwini TaxID=1538125 RepID=A0AAV4T0B9_9ARAC|nr:uncharacterized protein CDAR_107181 [Caerostris darwini]
MNNKYGREIGLGISCHVYGSLNCKGCCSGGQTGPFKDEKHVHFLDDGRGHDEDKHENFYRDDKQDVCGNDKLRLSYQYSTDGLCTCCKEASSQSRKQGFGRPILLYEIPKPKFDGISTHQSDFTPKPIPFRDLPPWHPILKDRWKLSDVPSLNKSVYQNDFSPQIALQGPRDPVYLAPKEKKDRCQELSESFKTWKHTTVGPNQTHEKCDKSLIAVQEIPPDYLEQHRRLHQGDGDKRQLHGPDCEKHCYSEPLMCHVESSKDKEFRRKTVHFQGDGNMISDIQECDTAVCVTKDDLTTPSRNTYTPGSPLLCPIKSTETLCNAAEGHPPEDCLAQPEHQLHYFNTEENRSSKLKSCLKNKPENCYITRKGTNFEEMRHPAGDGYDYFSSAELRSQLPQECNPNSSFDRSDKHVYFETQVPHPENNTSTENMHVYHPERSQNVPGIGYEKPSAVPDKFTVCENRSDNQPKYWWKRLTKRPPVEDTEIRDIPPHMVMPFGPYRTMYQKDFTEPPDAAYLQRLKMSQPGCSCSGAGRLTLTGRIVNPKVERGGIL